MQLKRSWLRWQPIRFSPWLTAYIILAWLVVIIVPGLIMWQGSNETFTEALNQGLTSGNRSSAPWLVVSAVLIGWLVWFTFFSGSKRVRDQDKFSVLLMLCGGAVGVAVILVRRLVHFF